MPAMGDIFHEAEEAVFGRLHHRHATQAAPDAPAQGANPYTQAPAQQPVNLAAATAAAVTKETRMSIISAIRADIATIDAKLEAVDETALNKLDAVMGNPETAAVLDDLAGLASVVGIPAGAITGVLGGAKTLLSLYAPDPAPAGQQPVQQPVPAQ